MCLYSGYFKTKPYRTVHSKTPEFNNSLVPQAGDRAPLHVNHKMEVHLTQYTMNSTVCVLFLITLQSIGLWLFSFLFNIKNASLGKLKPLKVSLAWCNAWKGTTGSLFFILRGRKTPFFRISAHKVQVHKAKKHIQTVFLQQSTSTHVLLLEWKEEHSEEHSTFSCVSA